MQTMKILLDFCEKIKTWMFLSFVKINGKFQEQFGFYIKETTVEKIIEYLYSPKDSSSLAVTRVLFGLAMLFDIPDERGGALMEKRWGQSVCHFPLIPFIKAVSMPYMALVYAGLWFGALGITLGYKYRWSAPLFTICYWYLFLIEKSYWNNHSYLFGLVALLLTFTEANCYWSLDVYRDSSKLKPTVPYWNYFILKYQFFILYFMAGLKKGTAEWLTGYSVQNLSEHWVFNPFKIFLTVSQTDFLIVHWFVFAFDLTVAIWMMWGKTRHVAMLLCALFHLMNSRLFSIGMFPWVCLATMPLFYPFDWPKAIIKCIEKLSNIKGWFYKYLNNITLNTRTKRNIQAISTHLEEEDKEIEQQAINNGEEKDDTEENNDKDGEIESPEEIMLKKPKDGRMKLITLTLIVLHVVIQAFLPYSHFITKGYNNWTSGLYGYSWDMMVHTWDIDSVVVKIFDNNNEKEYFIDPYVYSPNDRWTRHGDMVHQYARCLKSNIMQKDAGLAENISIYVDVWCSMNGRFTQRMFDPKVDLLNASWSAFQPMSYLMPLFDEALEWRSALHEIKEDVHSWNNYSDVVFIADFPGYTLEKYIPTDLINVTLTVLEGMVAYEPEVTRLLNEQTYRLTKGNRMSLAFGTFHKILNIGTSPAYYMYTFANKTEATTVNLQPATPKLPINQELSRRFNNMMKFVKVLVTNIFHIFFPLNQCQ